MSETGGINLNAFLGNKPMDSVDRLGLKGGHLGQALCDATTGKGVIPKLKEYCDENCLWQHEDEHRNNLSECRQRWHACFEKHKNDTGGAWKCRQAYGMWLSDPDQDDWDECQAYKREEACLIALTTTCAEPKKKYPHDGPRCCKSLRRRMREAKFFQNGGRFGDGTRFGGHCSGQKKDCPITPDGDPVGF